MHSTAGNVDRIVRLANELRTELHDATDVHRHTMASDDSTSAEDALVHLRAAIGAFLERPETDDEIVGDQSTE